MNRAKTAWKTIPAGLFLCLTSAGCALPEIVENIQWQKQYRQAFTTLNPEEESVAQIDIATMIWRRDQPMVNDALWTELDEQFLPLELRQALAQHGLRVGLMRSAVGSRLQAALANPEFAKDSQQQTTDVVRDHVIVGNRIVDVPKSGPVCTVEARRVLNRCEQEMTWPVNKQQGSIRLLVPDVEKEYLARKVSQVELEFAVQLNKLPDGLTRIRLVPVVKCALSQESATNVFMESLRLRNAVNKLEQRYEKLAVETTLDQNQYLVVTATRPENAEANVELWGDLAFMNYASDQQTVLVFRGASVVSSRSPDAPRKGNAWPLAWQATEVGLGK